MYVVKSPATGLVYMMMKGGHGQINKLLTLWGLHDVDYSTSEPSRYR